jgi:allantoin racemase
MTELDTLADYRGVLQKHLDAVASPGTQVDLHGLPVGTYGSAQPADVLHYPMVFHRIMSQLVDSFRRAEAEGYDAIAIASYTEPLLRELRSAVDIPVVSMGESTLLIGCSVAKKIGLVTISPDIVWMVSNIVQSHRLEERVAMVHTIEPAVNETALSAAFSDPEPLLASVRTAARAVIAAGADVVIPAEGILTEFLVEQGVTEVDGVCLMDGVGAVVLHAEMMAHLHQRTGLHAGRRWHYRKPAPEVLGQLGWQ